MPKRAMSFKPTPECEVQLAELMDRWKCDRTAALIKAVEMASGVNVALEKFHKKIAPAEPKVLPKDSLQGAKTIQTEKDTRTQQEKLDDFYRSNMAKGKK